MRPPVGRQCDDALAGLLAGLLSSTAPEQFRPRLSALTPNQLRAFFQRAEIETVLIPTVDIFDALGCGEVVPSSVRRVFEERVARRDKLLCEICRVSDLFAALCLDVTFVKGVAIQSCYDAPMRRQFGDIDIVLPDMTTFWQCADLLTQEGYVISGLVVRQDPDTGDWTGNAALLRAFDAELKTCIQFDVVIGAMHLLAGSTVPVGEDFLAQRERINKLGDARRPGRMHGFLHFLYGLAERNDLELRDLIDCGWMAAGLDATERRAVLEQARAMALETELARVVTESHRLFAHRPEVATALHDLGSRLSKRRYLWHRGRILRLVLGHALPFWTRKKGRLRGVFFAAQANVLESLRAICLTQHPVASYIAVQLLRVLPVRWLTTHGVALQFVQVTTGQRGRMGFRGAGAALALTTPLGVFAPAPYGVLFPKRLDAVRRMLAGPGQPQADSRGAA